jgi:hypothetical protein
MYHAVFWLDWIILCTQLSINISRLSDPRLIVVFKGGTFYWVVDLGVRNRRLIVSGVQIC